MRVGILGCGQLARMLTLAGIPLGISCLSFVKDINTENNHVTDIFPQNWMDKDACKNFCDEIDVITYETENIDLTIIHELQKYKPCFPNAKTLQICQDRLHEKTFANSLKIKTANFFEINSLDDLHNAINKTGLPCILKTRRMGYDGKGQVIIKHQNDINSAYKILDKQSLILEEFVSFDAEVSLISVRNKHGDKRFYPLTSNVHEDGILRISKAPYENGALQKIAEDYSARILEALDYVGVLAIEFFVVGNELYINELAPRVHNSGHWTIEGAVTSQFENHLRAILNLPIGETHARGYSVMINCISSMPNIDDILKIPNTHYHSYQKSPRANRKVGHVTVNTETINECEIISENIQLF